MTATRIVRGTPSDVPNPLKELRLKAGLTIDQVSRNLDLSKQFIIRSEQGVYTSPSETLISYYGTKLDLDQVEVVQRYYSFQHATRKANYGRLIEPWKFPSSFAPVGSKMPHPFREWRELSGISSAAGICKLYCVHPATVDKFENRSYLLNSPPEQLVTALLESGYSPETLDLLEQVYRDFKLVQREGFTVVVNSDS